MAYTAYKFQPSFIEERLKSYKSNLMKFKGHDNLVANAVRVIRERLEADPIRAAIFPTVRFSQSVKSTTT